MWTVKNAGTTGATIAGNVLNVPNAGTATVTATIAGGLTATTPYTKDFDISVTAAFVAVTDIELTSAETTVAGEPLTLAATVEPASATNQTIVWSVKNAGNTGATIDGNVLNVPNAGTAKVTATIAGGATATTPYTKDFDIDVTAALVAVTDITLTSAATIVAGTPLTLAANVEPATATNQTIVWTVKNAGTTGATIAGSVLTVPTAGTATVTATIAGGATATSPYTKDFDISVALPTLSLTPAEQTAIAFAADGTAAGNATFTVTTNTGGYDAVANKSWVKVTKIGNSFTVSATANTSYTAPEAATVTVTAGTATPVVLAVTQAAAAPTLALTPAEQTAIAFAADGTPANNAEFTVTTNTGGYEAVASASWVKVEKTGNSFTVSATPQTLDAAATLTVSANGADDIVLNLTIEGLLGVEINGVVWAKRNVDDFGTFAATPEATGKFYQWNRKKAWDATGAVTDWNTTNAEGTSWETENDPSPEGWRVPTSDELNKLLDSEKVSSVETTQNGVKGRLFTDKASGNTLFLPAAGYREDGDGMLKYAGTNGYYRSSTTSGTYVYGLHFTSSYASMVVYGRRGGLSVRSVAE
ncbi:hypothetical protein FACS189430_00170 [Bacteroidia bacterium]|nr:hypothetical protein FACS189430_00170 [Bacteroidia bacterium]